MKKNINKLSKSHFVRNVTVMATGAAGAQAITIALSPIITRLYGPEAFGIMGTFTALTSIIIPVAALTYPIAIVLPKSDKNAKGLIKLSIFVTLIIAFLTTIILLFFKNSILEAFQIEGISSFLYLIPLVIIFAGLMQVSEQWLIRTNQFSINAKANFMQSVVVNGGKVGIGLIYPTATVLVALQATGNGIKALMMIIFAKRSDYKGEMQPQERGDSVKKLAKKHRDFPLYRAPEEFFSAISQNIPILFLTSFFGPAAAGFYNIGKTVLSLPSRLIGQSIGDVFYPRISEAANNGESLNRLIIKATLALGAIGIIPFGTVIMFGPWLFEFVFGEGWNVAGEYSRWISLASFSVFMNKPSVRAIPVLALQRLYLFFSIIRLIIRSSALIVGFVVFDSDVIAIALFGITGALLNAVLILSTIKISKKLYKSN
ncbi:lipopolysaccharide biosynthesis protein [Lentibacillus cibarius]|uniref:Lipopolysaccharide biosynthesis protein n=1 Tax=Lentibacillus cibarius TaxID=2583219 RepID=A0A5S3QJ20_9BACI|nr:oligosaccharide flippase family protein [Lentibacillus cibarius]TMN21930.1 lipopolysaccharide biosynthesis protein [Lentibacillus cibarius]